MTESEASSKESVAFAFEDIQPLTTKNGDIYKSFSNIQQGYNKCIEIAKSNYDKQEELTSDDKCITMIYASNKIYKLFDDLIKEIEQRTNAAKIGTKHTHTLAATGASHLTQRSIL